MSADQLLLIDLSGIAHQIWHVSGSEPDPNFVSTQIIARVRALATAHLYAAICCDSGKSFRAGIDPTYKANRDTENRAPLKHQMVLACEVLKADGFPVWSVPGFEGDDLIASAVKLAMEIPDTTVLIASADKDMTQLVSERVSMKKITDGSIVGPDEVLAKFKVPPAQMHDWLCLVGDVSDNITGAKGIGGVTAAKLLNAHGSIAAIYEAMSKGVVKELTPALRTSMVEFKDRWPTASALVALKSDVEIPFAEIAAERVAKPMEAEMSEPFKQGDDSNNAPLPWAETAPVEMRNAAPPSERELDQSESLAAMNQATAKVAERISNGTADPRIGSRDMNDAQRIVNADQSRRNESLVVLPNPYQPVDFNQQLEPRNMEEAARLAGHMFKARLFNAYGTWEGVFSTILAGRELGLPAMASLRAFHIIESRPQLSADTIAALVLKSGKAKYFKSTSRTATSASFKTLRVGEEEEPIELTYTIEEARKAWKKDQKAWDNSSWGTNPADMLVARAKSKLARLVYPDVVGGMYSVEEAEL